MLFPECLPMRLRIVLALLLTLLAASAAPSGLPLNLKGVPTLAPMLAQVTPAVVNISVVTRSPMEDNPLFRDPLFRRFFNIPDQASREQSAGSGVIVDRARGYVLTNNHVISNAQEVVVTLKDRRTLKARLVGTDPGTDIAVLKIEAQNLAELKFGDSDGMNVGDFVVAIGNPFGIGQTVTSGIVSALGRTGLGIEGYEDFIQTDASINPGNSGGALVNLRGELIGINSAILSRSGGNIGIGFAIPSNMVRSVMEQLVKYGEVKRGILGVNIQTVTPDLADKLGAAELGGAFVQQVVEGSAADKAGVKAGDVITAVNGQAVRSAAELRNRIGLMRIGESVDLGLVRDGKPKHVTAVVQSRGTGTGGEEGAAADLPRALEGAELGDAPGGGVVVRSIEPGSPASQQPLKPNDVITAVDRHSVATLKDLKTAAKDQSSLLLTVRRGATTLKILVR
jgi:Do/DeqQ family serine protease